MKKKSTPLAIISLTFLVLISKSHAANTANTITCVEDVAIDGISTGQYQDLTKAWSVNYTKQDGTKGNIRSLVDLDNPVGGMLMELLQAAHEAHHLVTFKRNTTDSSCAGDGKQWFNMIDVN
jgi:hypothetical protein